MNKAKIIFIDDEEELCELYEELFSSDALEVYAFSDANIALEKIKEIKPNLCFLDFRMPKINGFELRKKIDSSIKCILLTGELDVELPDGFECILNKPLKVDEFNEFINKFLFS